jgi:hypothetical protein
MDKILESQQSKHLLLFSTSSKKIVLIYNYAAPHFATVVMMEQKVRWDHV